MFWSPNSAIRGPSRTVYIMAILNRCEGSGDSMALVVGMVIWWAVISRTGGWRTELGGGG